MQIEKLNEQIEVIAHFAPGKLRPLRFLWRGQAHKITQITGRWTTLEGTRKSFRYALLAEGVGTCEISLDVDKMSWAIQSVSIG